jgi:mono/diheme cytochrome c family protein
MKRRVKAFMVVRILGDLLRLGVLSGLMAGVCGGQEKQAQKVPEASSALLLGEELYKQHCVVCHGDDLKGNGPFPPPYRVPPDLSTLSRRHGGKFPEAYVSSVLRNGMKMPAHGPAEMPVWGTEFEAENRSDKTQVELRIRNLTNYLKSRQAKQK